MRLLFLGLFFCLFLRLIIFYFLPFPVKTGSYVRFSPVLLDDPKIFNSEQAFSVRLGNVWQSVPVRVTTSSDREFMYGQTLVVNGNLENKVLKNKQTIFTIQTNQIEAKNSGFLPIFGQLRAKIIDFCENNFSQPYSGLLVGIIFGIKSQLTNEVTTSFRITGLSHIVAASGMNVTLVAGFLFGLLGSFLKRKQAILVSLLGIFLYVCISGFDASILRAALMGGLAFSAQLFGRQYSSMYILFLVGCFLLLVDPLLLVDVGFQLSILATAGILLLKPHLSGSLLSDDLGTTLAAQVATLPVLLTTFGQYSLLSIVINLLILWTVPLITTIGGIGILVGLLVPFLGKLVITLIMPLLWYMVSIVEFFKGRALSVQISSLPIIFSIGYYFLLVGYVLFKNKQQVKLEKHISH